MNRKTPEKLTEWEAGQVLIKASDTLHECVDELKNEYPKYAKELNKMALRIGTLFNGHGSHKFGLADDTDALSEQKPAVCGTCDCSNFTIMFQCNCCGEYTHALAIDKNGDAND